MNDTTANGKRKRTKRGTGSLYKRDRNGTDHPAEWNGTGAFWLAYTPPGGKRIRQSLTDTDGGPITDKATAEAERRRIMAPYQTGRAVETLKSIKAAIRDAESDHAAAVETARGGIRIQDAWERYESSQTRPDSGPVTLRGYAFQWRRFHAWIERTHPESEKLADIGPQGAQEYAADLGAAGLGASTINKHIGLLGLVFRVLADDAGITANPWPKITRKRQRTAERRELTTVELKRVIQAAEGETRLLLAIGIYTGLRLGDCATLRWDEVDLARGRILRIPNKAASSGKAVKVPLFRDLAAMLAEAKRTTGGEYVLPESASAYSRGPEALTRDITRLFWNCGIDCHAPGTGYQIKRDAEGNPARTRYGNAELEATGKRAVVRVGFHSLRHSFVSLCREANAPLSVVESIVGHSNPSMTRHYSHTSDSEAERAVQSLPTLTGTSTPALPDREPIPTWALELIETMTPENLQTVKAAILKGGAI